MTGAGFWFTRTTLDRDQVVDERRTWLSRVDPDEHMNRWNAVGVQPGLFDQVAVIRLWGSREKDYQQVMVQAFEELEVARTAADELIREKVRRGYQVVGGYAPLART